VFEQLDGNDISYKIRLRHEVAVGSWNTDIAGPRFVADGPRISNEYVPNCRDLEYQELAPPTEIKSALLLF
jgi:hypothetical protein